MHSGTTSVRLWSPSDRIPQISEQASGSGIDCTSRVESKYTYFMIPPDKKPSRLSVVFGTPDLRHASCVLVFLDKPLEAGSMGKYRRGDQLNSIWSGGDLGHRRSSSRRVDFNYHILINHSFQIIVCTRTWAFKMSLGQLQSARIPGGAPFSAASTHLLSSYQLFFSRPSPLRIQVSVLPQRPRGYGLCAQNG